jgi:fermentation-respiration switch protein FrsA (DUF1100 family)
MRPERRTAAALVVLPLVVLALLAAALAGCTGRAAATRTAAPATPPAASATRTQPAAGGSAPHAASAVGVRTLSLQRGSDRPLRTVLWYPASGPAGHAPVTGAPVAAGRFPVLLFSHGLGGTPEEYAAGTTRLAAAGFVVIAPAYPHTSASARPVDPVDVIHQPADASAVLDAVLARDSTPADPLAGHLLTARVAALGHSAGGYTTAGLFGVARDRRLLAGVILSGGAVGGFRGAAAPLLFVHGDHDPVVDYRAGRAAYDADPWPRAFLTEVGGGHVDYLSPSDPGFGPTLATVTDFLRWTLYGDPAAKSRLPADAARAGVTRWESTL